MCILNGLLMKIECYMRFVKKFVPVLLLMLAYATCAWSSTFIINKIEVQGSQRVSPSTVLSYMPVKAGDRFNTAQTTDVIATLYKTGFFSDVSLYREKNNLIVKVTERSTISAIKISGNKKIKTEDLNKALKSSGVVTGEVFNNSTLAQIRQALLEQYYNLGRYNAHVKIDTIPAARNRIAVDINISEGPEAKIRAINVIGNNHYTDQEVKTGFSLTRSNLFSIFTQSDLYSKEKLNADLEQLRSFYFDRGYLEIKVNSVEVSITPDKRHVYIVIRITEGPQYKISSIGLSGTLLGKRKELQNIIDLKVGNVFSRKRVMQIVDNMKMLLGNYGYAFPNIDPQAKLNKDKHLVALNFVITPGKRVYVRRVIFTGNTKTADYVMRREMRQPEGGQFSLADIKESTRRLYNLGYLKNIQPGLDPVPGHPNEVDLKYKVEEDSSATASAQVGWSDADGFIYGGSVTEHNFMGTGKSVGVSVNNSQYSQVYSLNYYNPYATINGIGFSMNVFAQRMKADSDWNMSTYTKDNLGGNGSYFIPISEHSSISAGYGYEHPMIKLYSDSAQEYKDFVNKNGSEFDLIELNTGWNYSNLDRAVFPTQGLVQSLALQLSVPIFDRSLNFYKANYQATWYHPIYKKYLILDTHAYFGYGGGYAGDHKLPFFENYYSGGLGTVRGYQSYSLGPKDSDGNSLGGNVSINGSVGVIFPNPLGETVRTTAFVDAGNIYTTEGVSDKHQGNFNGVRFSQLRYSVGIQLEWRTPFAPLVFSLAKPLRPRAGDQSELFQFQMGASF